MKRIISCIGTTALLTLAFWASAAPSGATTYQMNDYCVVPSFLNLNIPPNLLLLIDNSASMYDLAYQDTTHTYCANAPTTACTADSQCASAGAASCLGSYATTTTTGRKACVVDNDCTQIQGDNCQNDGYCNKSTVTTTVIAPIACTTDSSCTTSRVCPAGATCTWATSDTCNNKCNVGRQCYDTTFDSTGTYSGYFNPAATYSYDFSTGKFVSGAAMPGSCSYSSGSPKYVCVNTSGTAIVANSTGFVASGSFLNWLTASKFDQEKQILTGGKYSSAAAALNAESRGCAGRKFIKSVPGMSLTFAIRGGTPGGITQTQSQAAEYGQTYIEVYTGTYNASECLSAMNDWINISGPTPPNNGTFQNDTRGCVGAGNTTGGSALWNHILHDCYRGILSSGQGYSTNLNPLEGACQNLYSTVAPGDMSDPNAGYAVCSSVLSYRDPVSGASSTGYLGTCWNGSSFTSPCDATQMANYCKVNVTSNPVTDPSSTAVTGASSAGSVPGFIMEQGLMNTNLLTNGLLAVKVGVAAPPSGLIQNYQGKIRFGAMTFNTDGSSTECGVNSNVPCAKYCSVTRTRQCYVATDCPTGESCDYPTNRDGGQIISFIGNSGYCTDGTTLCTSDANCPSGGRCNMAGDHRVGLINKINNVVASTWTPFAEGFYNAIGYYVNGVNTALGSGYTAGTSPAPIASYIPGSDSYTVGKCAANPGTTCTRTSDCPAGDQCALNPIMYTCQSNNVLLITDGASTADIAKPVITKVNDASAAFKDPRAAYSDSSGTGSFTVPASGTTSSYSALTCGSFAGSPYLHDLAYSAKNRNIFDPSQNCSSTPCLSSQTINSYVVYNGLTSTSGLSGVCNPATQMTATATGGGTSLYQASDYQSLKTSIDQALSKIGGGEASSTAASILSNSAGSGANILQAVFYPKKVFGNDGSGNATSASWIGEMLDLWYYIDPFINLSTIREDNTYVSGDTHTLDLKNNKVLVFNFDNDPASQNYHQTVVQRYSDPKGDGNYLSNPLGSAVLPDTVQAIWRAGAQLLNTSAASRSVYTPCLTGATCSNNMMSFASGGSAVLQPYLQPTAKSDGTSDAAAIINWVRGVDATGYRGRTVNYMACQSNLKPCSADSECPTNDSCGIVGTWKLGDIISSTPKVQSSVKSGIYDLPAPLGYSDASYSAFVNNSETTGPHYGNRGMAYVGANDGMLHAFKLGNLDVTPAGTRKATLTGTNLGAEQWAFIPTNALPYLRYLTCLSGGNDNTYCNNQDYGHLYYVDGTTTIADVSIARPAACASTTNYWQCDRDTAAGTNWSTVLVGGMGIGGASKDNADACTDGATGTCVKSPLAGAGYSSYFALDVTRQYFTDGAVASPPRFMWEFSDAVLPNADKGLGFATSGAAIVRTSARSDANGLTGTPVKTKNGRWFAVFGSGPTGPIDKTSHQFLATSSQPLKLYVVDLNKDPAVAWANGTNYWVISTLADGSTIPYSFVSSLSSAPIDTDRWKSVAAGNYQDNALYFGYVSSDAGTAGTWTKGGVLRLITNEDPDPSHWRLSKVFEAPEPVTTGISRLQDRNNHKLWLYFGTGRYFYNQDDLAGQRHIYALKEPCYTTADTVDAACTTTKTSATMTNQTSASNSSVANDGWYITLDAQAAPYGAERSITDAVALSNGAVFFSTFKPTSDICAMGGSSYLWALKYDTGLAPPATALKGQVMYQLSTGQFKQLNLADPTTFTDKMNRRTGENNMTGKPPTEPPPIVSTSNLKPVKRILQIQER